MALKKTKPKTKAKNFKKNSPKLSLKKTKKEDAPGMCVDIIKSIELPVKVTNDINCNCNCSKNPFSANWRLKTSPRDNRDFKILGITGDWVEIEYREDLPDHPRRWINLNTPEVIFERTF